MPEPETPTTPSDDDATQDSDFQVESASAEGAFDPPPADTTEAATAAEAGEGEGEGEGEGDESGQAAAAAAVDEGAGKAEDEPPAGQEAVAAGEGEPEKKKPARKSVKSREKRITENIDRLTAQYREGERKLQALNQQIADAEKKTTPADGQAAPAADGKTKPEAAELPAMPEPPEFSKFETDEEYTAAVQKWRADVHAWQTQRDEALVARVKGEVTSGLDARLDGDRAQAAQAAQLEAAQTRIAAAKAKHDDWDTVVPNLQGIRSSWYDETQHKEAGEAPFLMDLVKYNPEGGEILYWLASNRDRAEVLADLLPTRAVRDALLESPSAIPMLEYFSTDEGSEEFSKVSQMHPVRAIAAIGALSARLAGASTSGSPTARHSKTSATPPAKPPGGRAAGSPSTGSEGQSFESWMAEEDAKEEAERKRRAGVA